MNRIVVAFEGDKQRGLVQEALEGAGIPVRRACRSKAEAVRAVMDMGGGIVVCGFKLPDGTADEIAYDLGQTALVLVVSQSNLLDYCENPDLFKLPAPFSRGELVSSVRMLKQLEEMRLPRRSADDKLLIAEAKKRLMETLNMTESEAHKTLQRMSMASGEKLVKTAVRILEKEDLR